MNSPTVSNRAAFSAFDALDFRWIGTSSSFGGVQASCCLMLVDSVGDELGSGEIWCVRSLDCICSGELVVVQVSLTLC